MKVAVIGYEKVAESPQLRAKIEEEILNLIESGADTFYFCGTKNGFDPFKDIIDLSDVLLTYMKASGDRQLKFVVNAVKYAKIRKKKIINIFKLL